MRMEVREKARNIVSHQMPNEERLKYADFIIDNSGSKEAFENAAGIFITTLEEL